MFTVYTPTSEDFSDLDFIRVAGIFKKIRRLPSSLMEDEQVKQLRAIGQFLRDARQEKGLTQEQIACVLSEEFGMKVGTLKSYFSGMEVHPISAFMSHTRQPNARVARLVSAYVNVIGLSPDARQTLAGMFQGIRSIVYAGLEEAVQGIESPMYTEPNFRVSEIARKLQALPDDYRRNVATLVDELYAQHVTSRD
jgi:transcriptional regulator with XRE-family HTH domain